MVKLLKLVTCSTLVRGCSLLKWGIIFFLLSVIAAVFGFTGIAVVAAGAAQLLFYLFLFVSVAMLVASFVSGRKNRK